MGLQAVLPLAAVLAWWKGECLPRRLSLLKVFEETAKIWICSSSFARCLLADGQQGEARQALQLGWNQFPPRRVCGLLPTGRRCSPCAGSKKHRHCNGSTKNIHHIHRHVRDSGTQGMKAKFLCMSDMVEQRRFEMRNSTRDFSPANCLTQPRLTTTMIRLLDSRKSFRWKIKSRGERCDCVSP